MPVKPFLTIAIGALLVAFFATSPTSACDLLVRDFAFRGDRDVHRLCLFAHDDDESDTTAERLSSWLKTDAAELNLEFLRVNADDPTTDWPSFGIPSAPPTLPVVALIGRNNGTGTSFVISHWEPEPTPEDLAALKNSPVRQQLQQRLGSELAIILFSPDPDSTDSQARQTLDEFVKQRNKDAVLKTSVVELNRTDAGERLLLSFAGIRPDQGDWAGVVFGRGKLMGPPLVGAEITTEALDELFLPLDEACSCNKPLPTMGVDMPLVWNAKLTDAVVPLRETEDSDTNVDEPLAPPLIGLAINDAPDAQPQDSTTATTPSSANDETASLSLMFVAALTVAVIVVIVGITSVLVLRRRDA